MGRLYSKSKGGSKANSAPFVPRWLKITKTYADIATAIPGATTGTMTIYSLPANGMLHVCYAKHSTAFSGGSISAYTISIGGAGSSTRYGNAYNVFAAVADGTRNIVEANTVSAPNGLETYSAATNITMTPTSTTANLDQATAGSIDIWLLVSTLPV